MFPVTIDHKLWPTTEHYFQAQKFIGTPYEGAICRLSTPREAFDFSRKPEVNVWCRCDWGQIKEDVMKKALLAKFTQHSKLNSMLLGTRNRELVEHTSNDMYWGDGGDGSGQNRLGYLLMMVREELRQSQLSAHKLHQPSDDVQIIKVTYEQESAPLDTGKVSSPLNKPDKDLITFDDHQNDSQSDGIKPTTKPTVTQELDKDGLKIFDPVITIQSDPSEGDISEGLNSLAEILSDPPIDKDLKTPDTSNPSDMGPQPMDEGNPGPSSPSTNPPSDDTDLQATIINATTSDHVDGSDSSDMDQT